MAARKPEFLFSKSELCVELNLTMLIRKKQKRFPERVKIFSSNKPDFIQNREEKNRLSGIKTKGFIERRFKEKWRKRGKKSIPARIDCAASADGNLWLRRGMERCICAFTH